jgi:hypothetical protein
VLEEHTALSAQEEKEVASSGVAKSCETGFCCKRSGFVYYPELLVCHE